MSKLLLPPGIGDIHWVMLKMESFIEKKLSGKTPEIHICSMGAKDRAGDYIAKLPFVKWGGYYDMRRWKRQFLDTFVKGVIHEDFRGFDYLFGYNTVVEQGKAPAQWWPEECEPNYHYYVKTSELEDRTMSFWRNGGPYILLSFYRHGWYGGWWKDFPPSVIIQTLKEEFSDHRLVLTGADWDKPVCDELAEEFDLINMAGRTSIDELFGMIRGCDAYVGHAAGNAMMAVHYKRPTVMLWSTETFKPGMWDCWADPDNDNYMPWDLQVAMPKSMVRKLKEMI